MSPDYSMFKLWLYHLIMEYRPDKHEFSEPNRFLNLYFKSTSTPLSINNKLILGAIIGDITGSVFEWHNVKTTDFEMFGAGTDFTDDSVLTFATAVFLAHTGSSKADIKKYIQETFGYDLERRIDEIRPVYKFNETCQETVPEAIIAFLESDDYESAIRLAISIGGDSDTVACITGGIAEAYYKEIPEWMADKALRLLPPDVVKLIGEFSMRYRTVKNTLW